jgi:hypothetical protein
VPGSATIEPEDILGILLARGRSQALFVSAAREEKS